MLFSKSTSTVFKLMVWLAVVLASQVHSRALSDEAQAPTLTKSLRKFCGVEDNVSHRIRRDAPDNRWPVGSNLTYRVGRGPSHGALKDADFDGIVRLAFREWAPHCGLHFTQIHSGEANITISFKSRADLNCPVFHYHDGPGKTIAHVTNFPSKDTQSVEVHIDDEEQWSLVSAPGCLSFYMTLLHELGHALGLGHSLDARSIMTTYYDPDDITGTYSGSIFDLDVDGGFEKYKTLLFDHFTADVNRRNQNIDGIRKLLERSKNITNENFVEPSSTASKGPSPGSNIMLNELYDIIKT